MVARTPALRQTIACAHHWRIERPSGSTSAGVCKLCGATRQFRNYSYYPPTSRRRAPPASRARKDTPPA